MIPIVFAVPCSPLPVLSPIPKDGGRAGAQPLVADPIGLKPSFQLPTRGPENVAPMSTALRSCAIAIAVFVSRSSAGVDSLRLGSLTVECRA